MAPFTHISVCVSFFGKMSRLTLYLNSTIWSFMYLVRCKVRPKSAICTMSMLNTFLNVPICLKITYDLCISIHNPPILYKQMHLLCVIGASMCLFVFLLCVLLRKNKICVLQKLKNKIVQYNSICSFAS